MPEAERARGGGYIGQESDRGGGHMSDGEYEAPTGPWPTPEIVLLTDDGPEDVAVRVAELLGGTVNGNEEMWRFTVFTPTAGVLEITYDSDGAIDVLVRADSGSELTANTHRVLRALLSDRRHWSVRYGTEVFPRER